MYVGDFEDLETKELEEMIKEYGKTKGLANYMAVSAVLALEDGGNYETLIDDFYKILVDYIDE